MSVFHFSVFQTEGGGQSSGIRVSGSGGHTVDGITIGPGGFCVRSLKNMLISI